MQKFGEPLMKLIIFYVVFAALFTCSNQARSEQLSDKVFCSQAKQLSDKTNSEGKVWVDAMTRQDGMAVICNLKIIEYKKFLKANTVDMREGWQDRKQSQWDKIYCEEGSTFRNAIDNGWSVSVILTFINGEQHKITAKCKI